METALTDLAVSICVTHQEVDPVANRTYNVIDMVRPGSLGPDDDLPDPSPLHVRHFGFRQAPFADSVNPAFFFRTPVHEKALMEMSRCALEHLGFGLVTAPAGMGKSLLTRVLPTELDLSPCHTLLVFAYPGMGPAGLLREVALQLGVGGAELQAPLHELLGSVHDYSHDLNTHGRKLVVIIDECQFLASGELQMLRTFSNIEEPERKLITVLLFGDQSFLSCRPCPEHTSVLSRTFVRAQLAPLSCGEVAEYVQFRCLLGGGSPHLFTDACVAEIYNRSRGVPREVNRLCHGALSAAAVGGAPRVGPEWLPAL